jgi:hypothetical protein
MPGMRQLQEQGYFGPEPLCFCNMLRGLGALLRYPAVMLERVSRPFMISTEMRRLTDPS